MTPEQENLNERAERVGVALMEEEVKEKQDTRSLRRNIAYCLMAIFAVTNCAVIVLCFMNRPLSDAILGSLIGATAVELAAMMVTICKYLFPADQA